MLKDKEYLCKSYPPKHPQDHQPPPRPPIVPLLEARFVLVPQIGFDKTSNCDFQNIPEQSHPVRDDQKPKNVNMQPQKHWSCHKRCDIEHYEHKVFFQTCCRFLCLSRQTESDFEH